MATNDLSRPAVAAALARLEKADAAVARLSDRYADMQGRLADARARGHAGRAADLDAGLSRCARLLVDAKAKRSAALAALQRAHRVALAAEGALRKIERMADKTAAVQRKWAEDRRDEAKRVRRLTKALRARHAAGEDQRALPARVKAARLVEPPRLVPPPPEPPPPDLAPGQVAPAIAARMAARTAAFLAERRRVPDHWTPEWVGERMTEAFRTLLSLPVPTRPRAFGNAMPNYLYEAGDYVHQVQGGTYGDSITVYPGVTTQEVVRMEQALQWPMLYLRGDPPAARAVNIAALAAALGKGQAWGTRRGQMSRGVYLRANQRGLAAIAAALACNNPTPPD